MQRKFIHIFTITLLSLCLVEARAYAQEGEELPIKPDNTVIEKDSINTEEQVVEEPKGDMLTPIVITPKSRDLLSPDSELNTPKSSTKPASDVNGDKAKEDDNSPNLRFNLLYYLFYKVKVGSSTNS